MKNLLPLLLFVALLSSCSKKIDCDDAQTCLINNSPDTVFYNWICGSWHWSDADTLLPGDSVCVFVGPVTVRRQWESVQRVCLNRPGASYQWEVDDCYVERVIE